MWQIIIVCVVLGAIGAEAGGSSSYAGSGAGGYAGGYAGTGGYSGTGGYVGTGGYGGGYDDDYGTASYGGYGFPNFGAGFIDPYEFHQQLTAQILSQHAAQNNALASTFSDGDASVTADASSLPDDIQIQNQIAHQNAFFDNVRRQSHYNNKGYKGNRYAPNFASASGSIGPGGYYQSASIHPENAGNPNIVNRFSTSSGPGGYKGVSVSSFSSSSDVDGKRQSHRGAQTTINDNGKITTYKVQS